jgi:hypothetical protein
MKPCFQKPGLIARSFANSSGSNASPTRAALSCPAVATTDFTAANIASNMLAGITRQTLISQSFPPWGLLSASLSFAANSNNMLRMNHEQKRIAMAQQHCFKHYVANPEQKHTQQKQAVVYQGEVP